jgi:hypothetical protein
MKAANDPARHVPRQQLDQEITAALAAGTFLGAADTDRPRCIETHCSLVFLTKDRAFKLKKPISFSYLDYSNIEARERCIKAELLLNRRTAPQLYLRCHKIIRGTDGNLDLAPPDDPAPALDWLLEMRRFPDNALLADLAVQGHLTPKLIRDLADAIHAFHEIAERRPDHGNIAESVKVLTECIDNLRRREPPLDWHAVETLAQALDGQYIRHASLIERRRHEGFVRHCHGDLHLGNICVIDGQPVLFDCIDFSEMISCIDIAYDLAFVLMDLCHRKRLDFANLLLNRWLDRCGDRDALALMPFFLSLRAAIRAHILATSHRDSEAIAYLESASAHLVTATPCLIAIGGLSGSGKSTFAHILAPDLLPLPGARIIRSDSLRKRLAGVTPETRLPAASYSQEMSDRVYAMMLEEARIALEAGYAVILDAAFLREGERDRAASLAWDLRLPFHGIWLEAPTALLQARIAARQGDASDADLQVLTHQQTLDLGKITWRRVLAGPDRDATLAQLRELIPDNR